MHDTDDSDERTAGEHLSLIVVVSLLFCVLLLLALCFIVYYRRRYKRLKHTTELVVEFTRADMGDPGAWGWVGVGAGAGAGVHVGGGRLVL